MTTGSVVKKPRSGSKHLSAPNLAASNASQPVQYPQPPEYYYHTSSATSAAAAGGNSAPNNNVGNTLGNQSSSDPSSMASYHHHQQAHYGYGDSSNNSYGYYAHHPSGSSSASSNMSSQSGGATGYLGYETYGNEYGYPSQSMHHSQSSQSGSQPPQSSSQQPSSSQQSSSQGGASNLGPSSSYSNYPANVGYSASGVSPGAGSFSAQYTPSHPTFSRPLIPGSSSGVSPTVQSASVLSGQMYSNCNRTIWIGNLPPGLPVERLLDQVHFGALESVKIIPEKNCAFLVFLDPMDAAAFYQHCQTTRFYVMGTDLVVRWGKSGSAAPLPQSIQMAVHSGASRNVYIGGLPPGTTEAEIRYDVDSFGEIDNVRIVSKDQQQRSICFVHFCNIASAMKCVSSLAVVNPKYTGRRIAYGKDRCLPKASSGNTPTTPGSANAMYPMQRMYDMNWTGAATYDPTFQQTNNLRHLPPDVHAKLNPEGNRTVYLGSLPEDTIPEDLCNVVRAGLVEKVSLLLPEKACAFITFIDPMAATLFYHLVETHGLAIRSKRVKIGWGKTTKPPQAAILHAVASGASRNVYVGQLNMETTTTEDLLADFMLYGEIEVINLFKEKHCAFINYTDIRSALKAVEEAPLTPKYMQSRISFGKDRCASEVRLPKDPGYPIGGNIQRRNTGSYVCPPKSATSATSPSNNNTNANALGNKGNVGGNQGEVMLDDSQQMYTCATPSTGSADPMVDTNGPGVGVSATTDSSTGAAACTTTSATTSASGAYDASGTSHLPQHHPGFKHSTDSNGSNAGATASVDARVHDDQDLGSLYLDLDDIDHGHAE